MKVVASVARRLGRTRSFVVAGLLLTVALSVGAGVVLAGGSSTGITARPDGLFRAPPHRPRRRAHG